MAEQATAKAIVVILVFKSEIYARKNEEEQRKGHLTRQAAGGAVLPMCKCLAVICILFLSERHVVSCSCCRISCSMRPDFIKIASLKFHVRRNWIVDGRQKDMARAEVKRVGNRALVESSVQFIDDLLFINRCSSWTTELQLLENRKAVTEGSF